MPVYRRWSDRSMADADGLDPPNFAWEALATEVTFTV